MSEGFGYRRDVVATGKQCGNCKWFDRGPRPEGFETEAYSDSWAGGECKRHAPVAAGVYHQFPEVGYNDWCGDFEEKADGTL